MSEQAKNTVIPIMAKSTEHRGQSRCEWLARGRAPDWINMECGWPRASDAETPKEAVPPHCRGAQLKRQDMKRANLRPGGWEHGLAGQLAGQESRHQESW